MHWAHIRKIMELCASFPPLCHTVQFKGLLKSVAKGGKVRVDTVCQFHAFTFFDWLLMTPGELRRNRWAGVKNRAGGIYLIIQKVQHQCSGHYPVASCNSVFSVFPEIEFVFLYSTAVSIFG